MVKVGDKVFRMLAGVVEHPLRVTEVTEDEIICGAWKFCAKTGAEIDDYLNWGPAPRMTGSFLRMKDGAIETEADNQVKDRRNARGIHGS